MIRIALLWVGYAYASEKECADEASLPVASGNLHQAGNHYRDHRLETAVIKRIYSVCLQPRWAHDVVRAQGRRRYQTKAELF